MPVAASRSGGKAVRFCCTVASLFCLTGRGTVGKVGLGVGRRYQEGEDKKREGAQHNATQQTAKANVHACGRHENQADTENHLSTRYIVPRQSQCHLPPANLPYLAFGSFLPALLQLQLQLP